MSAVTATNRPLIAIVGQTASGKSALALELARRFKGEIICADARTVYKDMDIGTAKPTAEDQKLVRHYLLDVVVTPDQRFTAADFKRLAEEAIKAIESRGKLPILVGGTGLYIDSVLFDFQFRPVADPALRAELEQLSVEELQNRLQEQGIPLSVNDRNPRHLIRSLETNGQIATRKQIRNNTLVLGLEVPPEELKHRIQSRVSRMIKQGLEAEALSLSEMYGWQAPGMSAIGYREWQRLFNGETDSRTERTAEIVKNTVAYAKRQKTWFKRNKSIQWVYNSSEAVEIATTFLSKSA